MSQFKKAAETKEVKTVELTSLEVLRARMFDWGTVFDAVINGITIYGMRVLTTSADVDFIAFPSSKGKDGKYYNHCYARFSEDDQGKILSAVGEVLKNNG